MIELCNEREFGWPGKNEAGRRPSRMLLGLLRFLMVFLELFNLNTGTLGLHTFLVFLVFLQQSSRDWLKGTMQGTKPFVVVCQSVRYLSKINPQGVVVYDVVLPLVLHSTSDGRKCSVDVCESDIRVCKGGVGICERSIDVCKNRVGVRQSGVDIRKRSFDICKNRVGARRSVVDVRERTGEVCKNRVGARRSGIDVRERSFDIRKTMTR